MSGNILTRRRVEIIAWAMTLSGLLTGIGIETDWGKQLAWPVNLPERRPAHYESPPLVPPFKLNGPDAFLETSLRPLFVITRRPAPRLPDAPKETMKKGQFTLAGTMIVEDMKYAQLVEKTGGKTHVIAEGKEINGILVKEIFPARVILTMNDETEIVVLQTVKAPFILSKSGGSQQSSQRSNVMITPPSPSAPATPANSENGNPPSAGIPSISSKSRFGGIQQMTKPKPTPRPQ